MANWVHFKHWDFCLDAVCAVERQGNGSIRIYLRAGTQLTLNAAEGAVFLPRFNQLTKIEDLSVHLPDRADDD
jgi:hypothetical protein